MKQRKTLSVSMQTYRRLTAFGKKGDTFDAIISSILDKVETH